MVKSYYDYAGTCSPGRRGMEIGRDLSAYASGMYLISGEHARIGKVATPRGVLIEYVPGGKFERS